MPGSNIIHLDAYRQPDRRPTDVEALSPHPMLPAAALMTMGIAFWSNAFLLPAYLSLSVLEAWSQPIDD